MDFTNAQEIRAVNLKKDGDRMIGYEYFDISGTTYICTEGAENVYLFFQPLESGVFKIHAGDSAFAGGDKEYYIDRDFRQCIYIETAPYVVKVDGQNRVYFSTDFNGDVYAILR